MGYVVSEKGRDPDPKKIVVIDELFTPTKRHSYVNGEWKAKSGEQRLSKNSKLPRPNLEMYLRRIGYTQNIPISSKNGKIIYLFPWNV